ncbi:cupin domain-containing protein [Sphingomonas sp. NFR15]|uniref:cupin domain-containing protein n=1 Tax=Sphingomonas sp. NFR15 TaxID=1566282 RepID=UPI000882DFCA|nr:cupin domain-containing protein [Sphingomonas sp. NFR15]SDA19971.1 Cupin domain protein [Sphingomonas sp. NFR15]
MKRRVPLGFALISMFLLAAASPRGGERRLSREEAAALPVVAAGGGTSGLRTIETRLLKGNPARAGLYTISITVPPNTHIAAHTHRDDRTATVVTGLWHFGYGPDAKGGTARGLPPGSFYTEPAGKAHFAWTGPEGATVYITGIGPSDTRYLATPR